MAIARRGRDIQERAFRFACDVVVLHDELASRPGSGRVLGGQLLRASTSIGANLEEADGAQSRADFIAKCCISLKEAREAHYWLRILAHTKKFPPTFDSARLLDECDQLVAILTTIVRKSTTTGKP